MENNAGISIFTILFIVFLILKLVGKIAWSWWWVTAPIWGPIAVFFIITFIIFTVNHFRRDPWN